MKIKRASKEPITIVEDIVLSEEQELAVKANEDKVLVIAGAGSGKTRVIIERIKHLLSKGVDPSGIVAITFTNMASEEVKARLRDIPNIGDAFIGTIHSFANTIMKASKQKFLIYNDEIDNRFHNELIEKYCKHLTFDAFLRFKDAQNQRDLGLIDDYDLQKFLLPSELAELQLINGGNPLNPMDDDFDVECLVRPEDYPETIKTLMERYNVVTFNELLKMATDYFKSIDANVEYLIVDEFQDVGTLEYNFLESLKPTHTFYVGDDWQSIYGFKGGNVQILLRLMESEEYKAYYLGMNYRSSKEIIEFAQKIIDQVKNKVDKEITVHSEKEGKITVNTKANIVDVITDNINKENAGEWFILTRTNKELLEIQGILEDLNMRSVTFKREGLTNDALRQLLESNYVKVLTVHTSKGLENTNVILYGRFPVNQPQYRRNEEERKVMYVGVTRAKENLIVLN